jgi:RNA polymerase sigma-70 factor (ECF subfamily)
LGNDAESTLIKKALDGDEKAFRAILERHYALIYSVVRGIVCNANDTEDVVQDVFIKIFRALPGFRGDARLSTWIYRIARNEALNARERRTHEPVPIEDCEDVAAENGNPESAYRAKAAAERLARLMEHLDEDHRLVLELRYMADKSYDEIAHIMDVPLGTVKTHLYRAKLALKQMMTDRRPIEKGFGES